MAARERGRARLRHFDPRRCAILLLGGNKERQWAAWYNRNIPIAEDLYEEHLRELKKEGLI